MDWINFLEERKEGDFRKSKLLMSFLGGDCVYFSLDFLMSFLFFGFR